MKKLLTKSLSALLCLLLAVSVFAAMPVTADGTVDILDAAMIQKYTVGKIDFFPGGKG